MKEIKIGKYIIGPNHPPFIVAEMSGNHNQSLERAFKIVDAAAQAGVHALKLQTYTANEMTLDINEKEFSIKDPDSLWVGQSLHNLYKKANTPWEWHKSIFNRCKKLGLICFSTPFDEDAVVFLETLNVPCYKIASFENNHIPLIKKIAQTGKPIIMSTGMANVAELYESVRTIRKEGNNNIILLKCTSSYPASPEDSNILTIPHMEKLFNCQVGLSDHTLGIGASIASISLGATIIEKHFTLSREDGGVDAEFSLEPHEMKSLVTESSRAWLSLGKISYESTNKEKKSMQFRRSIYVTKNMTKGDVFSKENIRIIRPGFGLHPQHFDAILGKKISCDIQKGTALAWNLIG
jgi:pseudaminic acid synthase